MALYPNEMWLSKASQLNREILERLCSISTLYASTRKAVAERGLFKFSTARPADTERIDGSPLFNLFKEYKMPDEQPKNEVAVNHEKSTLETRNHDAKVAHAMGTIAKAINDVFEDVHWADANQNELGCAIDEINRLHEQNADLVRRSGNQRSTIESQFKQIDAYKARVLELEQELDLSEGAHRLTAEVAHDTSQACAFSDHNAEVRQLKIQLKGQATHINGLEKKIERLTPQAEVVLKGQLERAIHTQKILERDLEEYQQAYADLKADAFSGPDDGLPPRVLEFGHGHYLVYPVKVCLEDDDQDPKWGVVVDPEVRTLEDLGTITGKDVILADGDVAITFQKPEDVSRLIDTLEELRYRWFTGILAGEK